MPIVLVILDGFGVSHSSNGNAIMAAKTSFLDWAKREFYYAELHASGEWVGLPAGQMGNSEVGHLHLGAGRIIKQNLLLINDSIKDKSFFNNDAFLAAFRNCERWSSNLHFIGLASDGGVHSHIDHLSSLIDLVTKMMSHRQELKVFLHLILDGRDTKRDVGVKFVQCVEEKISRFPFIKIASVGGRYYGMDRDKRWERNEIALRAIMCTGNNNFVGDPSAYIRFQYEKGTFDEFIVPAFAKQVDGRIKENDSVIFINFRPDRAIQLASILTNSSYRKKVEFDKFVPENIFFVAMMPYADSVKSNMIAFYPMKVKKSLPSFISEEGYKQLRIAESEKKAHVTYFLNGGNHNEFLNEERVNISSNKKVATYDEDPVMKAGEIKEELIKRIRDQSFDVAFVNFANADMVGHTGSFSATKRAVECLDKCLDDIYKAIKMVKGEMIITADHGNAEKMLNKDGSIATKHTSSKVPLFSSFFPQINKREKLISLSDVAWLVVEAIDSSLVDKFEKYIGVELEE